MSDRIFVFSNSRVFGAPVGVRTTQPMIYAPRGLTAILRASLAAGDSSLSAPIFRLHLQNSFYANFINIYISVIFRFGFFLSRSRYIYGLFMVLLVTNLHLRGMGAYRTEHEFYRLQ